MNKLIIAIVGALVLVSGGVQAENLPDLLKKVQDYANAGNFSKAIAELDWVRKELEKGNQQKLQEFFPKEVAGYSRGNVESANVMGMSNTEASYKKDSSQVKVSLTGGTAGGALAGLAGLGQMAAMFGGQPGVDSFRINGRTAQLNEQGASSDLTVFLESGSLLKFEGGSASDLRALAEGFGIEKLDGYLKGQG